jgi:hypothetical protein
MLTPALHSGRDARQLQPSVPRCLHVDPELLLGRIDLPRHLLARRLCFHIPDR